MIKSTLGIISASVIATMLAGTLFLSSILGAFGLVATSANNLGKLLASQQVVDKIKAKHQAKKSRVTRRFAKRTGKRVASSAVAAATIGTVAVVAVVAGLEVVDYCEEKEALNEEGNILYNRDETFDYEFCLEEGMEDSRQIIETAIDDSSTVVQETWSDTRSYSIELWEEFKASSLDMINSTTESTTDAWDAMWDWMHE